METWRESKKWKEQELWQRSEEVAGHHLLASYVETKRLLKSVYEELNRPEGAPLRTFEEAFKSKSFFTDKDSDCEIDTKCFSADYLFKKLTGSFLWMTEMMIKELQINYTINEEHFNPNSNFLKCRPSQYKL